MLERAKKLFEAKYANVQPHSGAKCCCFFSLSTAILFLEWRLIKGGHLTHGAKVIFLEEITMQSNTVSIQKQKIDYGQVERLAQEHKPKMIIAGFSAYMGIVDWAKFRKIADEVGITYW